MSSLLTVQEKTFIKLNIGCQYRLKHMIHIYSLTLQAFYNPLDFYHVLFFIIYTCYIKLLHGYRLVAKVLNIGYQVCTERRVCISDSKILDDILGFWANIWFLYHIVVEPPKWYIGRYIILSGQYFEQCLLKLITQPLRWVLKLLNLVKQVLFFLYKWLSTFTSLERYLPWGKKFWPLKLY